MNKSMAAAVIGLAIGCVGGPAVAASPPKAVLIDHSMTSLIDSKAAVAMLGESIPARVWKLYPANKWGYVTQVQGGFTASGTCVVTARTMIMALTPTLKVMMFRPYKTATAFDAAPGLSQEACRDVAKQKLQESINGVVSSLVNTPPPAN
jgi:hypothetical protein